MKLCNNSSVNLKSLTIKQSECVRNVWRPFLFDARIDRTSHYNLPCLGFNWAPRKCWLSSVIFILYVLDKSLLGSWIRVCLIGWQMWQEHLRMEQFLDRLRIRLDNYFVDNFAPLLAIFHWFLSAISVTHTWQDMIRQSRVFPMWYNYF